MPRIKIELPEKFIFKTELSIRITDINYGGHLGNDKILSLIQEARVRFLKEFGYSEMNIEGFGIIMIDAAVEYKSEGFYGDPVLIEAGIGNIDKIGFDIFYRMQNKASGKEIALAKTGILIFDYGKRKITAVPEAFVEKLKAYNA
ncbi:MAG: acyl-CoA thioesterase [Ignavibacteria bacterium]